MRFLSYRPANGFKRIVAYLIDTMPIQILLYFVSMAFFGVSPIADAMSTAPQLHAAAVSRWSISLGTMAIWILYGIVAELSPWRGTLGKKLMGLEVKSADGRRLTVLQVIGRNFLKIVSYLPLGIGFIVAFVSHGNRAWHDMLSGTAVAERK